MGGGWNSSLPSVTPLTQKAFGTPNYSLARMEVKIPHSAFAGKAGSRTTEFSVGLARVEELFSKSFWSCNPAPFSLLAREQAFGGLFLSVLTGVSGLPTLLAPSLNYKRQIEIHVTCLFSLIWPQSLWWSASAAQSPCVWLYTQCRGCVIALNRRNIC